MESRRTARKTKAPQRDRTLGVTLISAAAAALGIGGAVAALLFRRRAAPAEGHPVPDLAAEATVPQPTTPPSNAEDTAAPTIEPEERAPEHFRPDPTAVPSADEREALRPATGPAPSLAADRGSVTADAQDAA